MNIKKLIVNVVKVSVTGLILLAIFWKFDIDRQDVVAALTKDSSPAWWIASLFTQAAAIFFSILRWRVLLHAQNLMVPDGHLVRTYLVGRFLGTFTPTGIGLEAYKAYDTARYTKKATESVAVVVVEKFLTILTLSLLVLSTLPFINLPAKYMFAVVAFFGIMLVATSILVIKPTLLELLLRLPLPAKGKIKGIVNTAVEAFNRYSKNKLTLVWAVGFGVLVYFALFSTYFTNGKALGIPPHQTGTHYTVQLNSQDYKFLDSQSIRMLNTSKEETKASSPGFVDWLKGLISGEKAEQIDNLPQEGVFEVYLTADEAMMASERGLQLIEVSDQTTYDHKGLSLFDVMKAAPLTQIASMVPLSIAGVGLREAGFTGTLHLSGVWVAKKAVFASLMWYFVSISLNIVGAIIFLTRKTDYQASREEIDRVLKGN